jgi:hypothetical protein
MTARLPATAKRRNKYGAKPTVVGDLWFASKHEARVYNELQLLEKAGQISKLQRQVPYVLRAEGGAVVGRYIADFAYYDNTADTFCVADAKGVRTELYKWKKRHFEAEFGIKIVEM